MKLVKRMRVSTQSRGPASSLLGQATNNNIRSKACTKRRGGGASASGWKRRQQGQQDRNTKALLFVVRAKEEEEEQEELYDYGTEKVRNLLKRDSKELRGIEELGETAQAYQPSNSVDEREGGVESRPEPESKGANPVQSPFGGGASGSAKQPVQSPFGGGASGSASGRPKPPQSPFGGASTASTSGSSSSSSGSVSNLSKQKLMSPFKFDAQDVDVEDMSYMGDERPWWQPQITLTQVVLVISFSLLVVIMLLTFSIVFKSGAIRLNA